MEDLRIGTQRLRVDAVALRIAAIYLAVGALWIVASDRVLAALVSDLRLLTAIQTVKGWAYVLVTSLLLYILIHLNLLAIRRGEEELSRLATAVEQAAEAIVMMDPAGAIRYVNPAFEGICGFRKEEVLGQELEVLGCEDEARTFERAWETLRRGQPWRGHLVCRKHDGSSYEAESTISPVRDGRGSVTNYVAVSRDVTEQMRLERQMREAQKIEALGTLAGGIAHDFNNILTPIIGYSELALEDLPEGHPAGEDLERVVSAARRAKDLVAQILAFARQGEVKKWPLQLGHAVKEALRLVRASLPSTIEIRASIETAQDVVLADPTQIHQVVLNLCNNAAQAIGDALGSIEVAVTGVQVDEATAARHPGLEPGSYLRLDVTDTGQGMGPEVTERIFEPFFTTKEVGKGTGLGLAVVRGIVQGHGGAIWVESAPGKGAAFHVFLPAADERAGKATSLSQEPVPRGTERILFVDDEEAVAGLGKRALERLGYSVVAATGSVEALDLFRRDPQGFDLVVSDLTMPKMTGVDLIREIHRLREVPAILCTGLGESVAGDKVRAAGVRATVTKPLLIHELAAAVRRAIDEAKVI